VQTKAKGNKKSAALILNNHSIAEDFIESGFKLINY
jgi:hypothetical protein